jgi:preprotein translocase subunit SecF
MNWSFGKKEKIWQKVFFLDLILVILIAFSVFLRYSIELKNGAEREMASRAEASIVSSRLYLALSGNERKEKNAEEKSRTFTPLESSTIYGKDEIDKISIPYRKGEVKAPSFLTGFTWTVIQMNDPAAIRQRSWRSRVSSMFVHSPKPTRLR